MNKFPIYMADFYKIGHVFQYPPGTSYVYSNLTPRSSRMEGVENVVFFGLQYFLKEYLIKQFNESFFDYDLEDVLSQYKKRMDNSLGKDSVSLDHIKALHDLQYLPLKIKALPEGSLCPLRVPVLSIQNTKPEFFWLTNFIETILCTSIWQAITSATIAREYRILLDRYAQETSDIPEFVQWQGHDFSYRGMSSHESACLSGAAHLLSFTGTDTIPAIDFLEEYYCANAEVELIGGSCPATEHSVMCAGGEENEIDTIRRLLKIYPKGVLSVVCDSWNYFGVLTRIIPQLKNEIMARDGAFIVRPDSGDPVKIVCGDENAKLGSNEFAGSIEILWEIFGGTINSKGYKQLNSHIGCIYGDSITLKRCEEISRRLKEEGFASTNMIYGIGSYTYQHNTRDTFGLAMKATFCTINEVDYPIFKDPKTDDGTKRSARGLLRVDRDSNGRYILLENVTPEEEQGGCLETVFCDGKITKEYSLAQIRKRVKINFDD